MPSIVPNEKRAAFLLIQILNIFSISLLIMFLGFAAKNQLPDKTFRMKAGKHVFQFIF